MVQLWVLENSSAQVLCHYLYQNDEGSSIKGALLSKSQTMQFFAPIILAQKLFQEVLHISVGKIQVGSSVLLISSHHLRYTMVVGDGQGFRFSIINSNSCLYNVYSR